MRGAQVDRGCDQDVLGRCVGHEGVLGSDSLIKWDQNSAAVCGDCTALFDKVGYWRFSSCGNRIVFERQTLDGGLRCQNRADNNKPKLIKAPASDAKPP